MLKLTTVLLCIVAIMLCVSGNTEGQESGLEGSVVARQKCASCHAFEPLHLDWAELARTQGPDLSYSGTKFNPDWLVQWLQFPDPIRPAGYLPFRHTISTPSGDQVITEALPKHIAVTGSEAQAIVSYLLTLKREMNPFPQPNGASPIDGEVHFNKLLPCAGCHRSAGHAGGVSGP